MNHRIDEAGNRSTLRRLLHLDDPLGLLAAVSLVAAVVAAVLIQPWRGWSPFRSSEILIVPTLAAFLLLPAYVSARLIPDHAYAKGKELAPIRPLRALWDGIVAILVVCLIWVVFNQLLTAKWGIIDDHEIMALLGPSGKLGLWEIPSRFVPAEVGAFGNLLRYRPSAELLRLLEAALWGADPRLWYASRIGLLVSGAFVFWLMAKRIMGALGAALLVAYALSIPFWGDVVGRLGPSEAYAVAGLPLFIAGVAIAIRCKSIRTSDQIPSATLLSVGGLICIGSKENLLILTLPILYLLYVSVRRRQWLISASAILVLIVAAVVASSVLIATARSGVDYYGRSISLVGRLRRIADTLLERRLISPFTMLLALTAGLGVLLLVPGMPRPRRTAVLRAQAWLGVLCLVYLSQSVFYNGDWPSLGGRYDFPGLLYLPAAVMILFWLGRQLMAGIVRDPHATTSLKLAFIVSMALTVAFHRGYSATTGVLRGNVDTTIAFTDNLERLVAQLRQDPDLQVVVEGTGNAQSDFEPILGFPKFLQAYQVTNPLFVRTHGTSVDDLEPGFYQQMALTLERTSLEGDDFYSPLYRLDDRQGDCLSVFIATRFPTRCEVFEWDATPAEMPRLR